jgi:hypothetical protein
MFAQINLHLHQVMVPLQMIRDIAKGPQCHLHLWLQQLEGQFIAV